MRRMKAAGWVMIIGLAVVACADTETADSRRIPPLPLTSFRAESQLANGWMNAKTLQLHLITEKPDPKDLVIRGVVEGGTFMPTGDIEEGPELQSAPLRGRVERAWLEVTTRRIAYVKDGVPPMPPYLDGKFDQQTSLFYPDSRILQRTPLAAMPDTAPAGR